MAQLLSAAARVFLHPREVQPLLPQMIGPDAARGAGEWFAVLADPTRVRILHALSLARRWCAGDLALALGLSASALSHQLAYLDERGIVTRRKEGRLVFCALADEHVRHVLRDALAHLQEPT
jgi:DNA-binding transcriptional ArsR family regulator